jgi:hypothetical protein
MSKSKKRKRRGGRSWRPKESLVQGPRLDQAVKPIPVSEPMTIPYGEEELEGVCFKYISDNDELWLQTQAELNIASLYAEGEGDIDERSGIVASWLMTDYAREKVFREYELLLIIHSCVYKGSGGDLHQALDEEKAREVMTAHQQLFISGEITSWRAGYNPNKWSPEIAQEMTDLAKKNSLAELSALGSGMLGIFTVTLVNALPSSLIDKFLAGLFSGSPLALNPMMEAIIGKMEEASPQTLAAINSLLDERAPVEKTDSALFAEFLKEALSDNPEIRAAVAGIVNPTEE